MAADEGSFNRRALGEINQRAGQDVLEVRVSTGIVSGRGGCTARSHPDLFVNWSMVKGSHCRPPT